MKPLTAYYCAVQYRHDLSRPNAANIGVVLFCPETQFLEAKLSPNAHLEGQVFHDSSVDPEWISLSKQALLNRLKHERSYFQTVKDLEDFAARRANQIRLTPPQTVTSFNLEQDLDQLFEKTVGANLASLEPDAREDLIPKPPTTSLVGTSSGF